MGTRMCMCVLLNVCTSVNSMCALWCQPCPSGLRSPGSCSLRWVTFLGRALGQSSCLMHLSSPLFPLAGPPSLIAHAITQWHSFIYCCTPAPPLIPTHTLTQSVCAHTYHDKTKNLLNRSTLDRGKVWMQCYSSLDLSTCCVLDWTPRHSLIYWLSGQRQELLYYCKTYVRHTAHLFIINPLNFPFN